jgi:polysaccharide export outer membrane protein
MHEFVRKATWIAVCGLFITSAWPQSKQASPPVSRAGVDASNPVTPQIPTVVAPEAAPNTSHTKGIAPDSNQKAALEAKSPSELHIGPGDLVEISVFGAPDFNRQVRVDSSGNVSLPLIGEVRLAGLNTSEGERLVEKKLVDGGYFNDPHVSIFEKEYQTQGVSILGEVQKPGIYPMLGPHKLLDVISTAGGTTAKAGNEITISHRDQTQPSLTLTVAGKSSDSTNNNPNVLPGDTVVVQKAGVIYVVGDVRMPGGFIVDKPELTVLQALAMAQGANPTAKLDGARLIRRSGEQRQEVPIDLKKILASKAHDVSLQAEDILFVPNSTAKTVMRHGFEAIVQAATGLAIYH